MQILMLLCEMIIGVAGIYTIIAAKDLHDRMHGVLVVLLCLDGLCEHFFAHYNIITEIMLGITATYALFFVIFFSISDVRERNRYVVHMLKKKNKKQREDQSESQNEK